MDGGNNKTDNMFDISNHFDYLDGGCWTDPRTDATWSQAVDEYGRSRLSRVSPSVGERRPSESVEIFGRRTKTFRNGCHVKNASYCTVLINSGALGRPREPGMLLIAYQSRYGSEDIKFSL